MDNVLHHVNYERRATQSSFKGCVCLRSILCTLDDLAKGNDVFASLWPVALLRSGRFFAPAARAAASAFGTVSKVSSPDV